MKPESLALPMTTGGLPSSEIANWGSSATAVREGKRIGERAVAGRAGRRSVDLNQQREVDRVRLIQRLHGLGDVAELIDDGIACSSQAADDAEGQKGH